MFSALYVSSVVVSLTPTGFCWAVLTAVLVEESSDQAEVVGLVCGANVV